MYDYIEEQDILCKFLDKEGSSDETPEDKYLKKYLDLSKKKM